VRKKGMHMGIYFSGGLDWSFTEKLQARAGTRVEMLGSGGTLSSGVTQGNLHVRLPDELPGDYAYTLVISPRPI
jgi:hypothetical protein